MKRCIICVVAILWSACGLAVAQSNCELSLTRAQEEFDGGRFYSVPDVLKECLAKNQNRDWEQRAYLLLAETYLLLEDAQKAEESYLRVLQANPEFVADESRDPIDLVYLSKKFTATPLFSFYGKVGLNATFVRVIHDVRISPQGDVQEKYSTRLGWQGGVGFQYHYSERIGVSAELNYLFSSFRHNTSNLFQEADYSVDFTERQTWINIPILVRYTWPVRTLQPFVYAGMSVNFLLQDKTDIVINGNVESPVFDFDAKRNFFNRSLIAGGGLRYKWNLRYLFGEVRYAMGMTNLTDPRSRYDEINQAWPYVDDDFRIDNLVVNIGYLHPLYKARKLRHAKTKSVLRRLERRSNG